MAESLARYRRPTREQVLSVRARLGNLQLRRAFYGKLENPHWVEALRQAGAFVNPPGLITAPDWSLRADPWPEIDYLARMADQVPTEITAIFKNIMNTKKPLGSKGPIGRRH
jgi:hypothetical protein